MSPTYGGGLACKGKIWYSGTIQFVNINYQYYNNHPTLNPNNYEAVRLYINEYGSISINKVLPMKTPRIDPVIGRSTTYLIWSKDVIKNDAGDVIGINSGVLFAIC